MERKWTRWLMVFCLRKGEKKEKVFLKKRNRKKKKKKGLQGVHDDYSQPTLKTD